MQKTQLFSNLGESEGIPLSQLLKKLPQNPLRIFAGHSKWGRIDVMETKRQMELESYTGERELEDNKTRIQELINQAKNQRQPGIEETINAQVYFGEDGSFHQPRPPKKKRPQEPQRGLMAVATSGRPQPVLATSQAGDIKLSQRTSRFSMEREQRQSERLSMDQQSAYEGMSGSGAGVPVLKLSQMDNMVDDEGAFDKFTSLRGSSHGPLPSRSAAGGAGSLSERGTRYSQLRSGMATATDIRESNKVSIYDTNETVAAMESLSKMKELEGKSTLEKFLLAPNVYGSAATLRTKLSHLKDSTDEYEEFQRRIRAHNVQKKADMKKLAGGRDLVRENKAEAFVLYQPDIYRAMRGAKLQRHQDHIFEVQDRYLARRQDEINRKYLLSMRKDIREQKEKEGLLAEEYRIQRINQGTKWIVYVALATRASLWFYALKEHKGSFNKSMAGVRMMVLRLQANFRRHLAQKELRRKKNAVHVICSVVYRFFKLRRQQRKEWAAKILKMFLTGVSDSKSIVLLMKSFRFKIIRIQKAWRNYKNLQAARHAVLCVQWDRLLPTYIHKRFGAESNKSSVGVAKKSPKNQVDSESMIVRNPTLWKTLNVRRAAQSRAMKQFEADYVRWEEEEKERQRIENARNLLRADEVDPTQPTKSLSHDFIVEPPVKPKFKLLLGRDEMLQLIERSIGAYELSVRRGT